MLFVVVVVVVGVLLFSEFLQSKNIYTATEGNSRRETDE